MFLKCRSEFEFGRPEETMLPATDEGGVFLERISGEPEVGLAVKICVTPTTQLISDLLLVFCRLSLAERHEVDSDRDQMQGDVASVRPRLNTLRTAISLASISEMLMLSCFLETVARTAPIFRKAIFQAFVGFGQIRHTIDEKHVAAGESVEALRAVPAVCMRIRVR